MWVGPVFVLAAIVLRLVRIDYAAYTAGAVAVTGGIDEVHAGTQSAALALAAPANFGFIFIGIIGLIFVRGRAQRPLHRRHKSLA